MKVKSIHIANVGCITDITLEFNDQLNLICGPNGIGKTTIIECITHAFAAGDSNILKRSANSESGSVDVIVGISDKDRKVHLDIKNFDPTKGSVIGGLHEHSNHLLSLKAARGFSYQSLPSINRDVVKPNHVIYEEAKHGISTNDVKSWFVNRETFSYRPDVLTESQMYNLELAKECFSLLDPQIKYSRLEAATLDIWVNSPNGEIYYEYLSSGFKSCLSILFSVIKEIEFRFKSPQIKAHDFDGIILIDEIELHLHPSWQTRIAQIVCRVFPKAQFIVTTHSPHVIQYAEAKEIIALTSDADGNVYRKPLASGKYGYKGWSVEEVLTNVMGMEDTKTKTYHDLLTKFYISIDSDDYESALDPYNELNEMLHPSNYLRKLLRLQLAALGEVPND